MYRCILLLIHICLASGVRERHQDNSRDCRVASLPLANNVDFRKYPLFVYHQLNIGNHDDIITDGVSFIERLTYDTVSSYASARNSTTLECGVDLLGICRNVPAGSSTVRQTAVNIPEPFTQTIWLAAANYKDYLMFYICKTALDDKGACPLGQSHLVVETTTAKLSKRIFNIALSVASRLCIDPKQWLNLRNGPPCPKVLALRSKHERRMRKMRKQGRGYGFSKW